MKPKSKIIISLILVVVLIAGGYVGNMFGVFNRGNYGEYSLKNTATVQDSPTKAGYRDWWLPEFQECLYEVIE